MWPKVSRTHSAWRSPQRLDALGAVLGERFRDTVKYYSKELVCKGGRGTPKFVNPSLGCSHWRSSPMHWFFFKLFLVYKTYPLLDNLQLLGPFLVIFGRVLAFFFGPQETGKKTNSVSYQAWRTCMTLFLKFCGWWMEVCARWPVMRKMRRWWRSKLKMGSSKQISLIIAITIKIFTE